MFVSDKSSDSRELPAADLELLDAALDRAVSQLENGGEVDLSGFARRRPDLRSRLDEVARAAHEIAVAAPARFPELPDYLILREIGRGGLGTVYLARQERLASRLVALKVLSPGLVLSPRSRERFVQEVQALARIRHPNIVAIYDVVQLDGGLAYAMEWIDGPTLASLIGASSERTDPFLTVGARLGGRSPTPSPDREGGGSQNTFDRDAAERTAGQVPPEGRAGVPPAVEDGLGVSSATESIAAVPCDLEGGAAVQGGTGVSPDWRPAGVSPAAEGGSGVPPTAIPGVAANHPGGRQSALDVVTICRLGIAVARALGEVHRAGLLHRDVKPSNILIRRDGSPALSDFGLVREIDSTALTEPGHFAGTAAYAPPEQLRADARLDARADVYSLGVTLYHALARRLPFTGATPAALLRQIETGAATPLRRANPRLPRDLETIIAKAMEPEAARRYATADEVAEELERVLALQPIRAKPAGPISRTIKLMRRNRGAVAGALLGGLAAALLAMFAAVYCLAFPTWAAEHRTAAHVALLDPDQDDRVLAMVFSQERLAQPPAATQTLDAALGEYAAALRFAPWDRRLPGARRR
ncbi:MAG: serine/threonine-protein kinase [Phycisphaerae bacterium]